MSTKRMARSTRRIVVVGGVTIVAIGAATMAASAVAGSHDSPPVVDAKAHAGSPVAYGRISNGQNAGTSAPSTPPGIEKKVAEGLSAPGLVKAIAIAPGLGKSAVSVLLQKNDDTVPANWNAELAVGAAAQLSVTNQTALDQVLSSAVAVGPDTKGADATVDLGVGGVAMNQVFDSPSDDDLTSHVDEVAERYGLTVSSVEVLHPLESALAVTFVVPPDAKSDWTIDDLRTALVGAVPDVEGVLIQLNSPDGSTLVQASSSYRTGSGGLWFAPGQDSRFGAVHGGLPGK